LTSPTVSCSVFVCRYRPRRDLHSFPTRRSSDLARLVVDGIVAFLECIEFFKYLYRDGHIMLLEVGDGRVVVQDDGCIEHEDLPVDRKSTRLNSSHVKISYAVFCLKKKKFCTAIA